jgi:2-hydroxychromene-2-carboxylate isomerase
MTKAFYFDVGSPYVYLTIARLPLDDVEWKPISLGGLWKQSGGGSWALTDRRAEGIAEIEARAERYGLPPIQWPPGWPPNTLQAMRAVVWAQQAHGAGDAFARTAFHAAFAEGADLGDPSVLSTIAERTGLPAADLATGIAAPAVKDALHAATDAAITLGVCGVPTLALDDGRLVFGDDRLEEAA